MSTSRLRDRSGSEHVTARSALGLRLLLSAVFAPLFLAACGLLAWWSAGSDADSAPSDTVTAVLSAVCGVLFLVAVADLAVLVRRRSRAGHGA
ncbi:DUF6343 family protein [Streptomyces minutiscleroticus]|uniref:Uncharacterized protein n=1 Tax=Streptomyces minutiscleroticus TaxID=68238 RepID=A0A918U4H5_9ACTN|nr:DUF6343 family protein [Streptomyces minutiscleroticus]GGX90527.1 hypothetical protein GCM10010358_50650 [Streptomyces minutiscleroticus]